MRGLGRGLLTLCALATAYSLYGAIKAAFIGGTYVPPIFFLPALYGGNPYRKTLDFEAHALDVVLFGGILAVVFAVRKKRRRKNV